MAFTTKVNNLFMQRLGLVSISKTIVILGSIVLLPVLTKTLPVVEYAIWVQMLVLLGMLLSVADMGLTAAMIRFFPTESKLRDKFSTIFLFVMTISISLSFLPLLVPQQIANYLFGGWTKVIYFIPFILPIIVLNNVCMSYFRARQQIKKLSFFTVLQSLLVVGVVCITVISHPDILTALSAYGLVQITLLWTMLILIVSEVGIGTPTLKYLKEYLTFGLPALPQTVATWAIVGSDRYLIGIFLGITFVGYYAPAYGLGSSVMLFMAPLGTLLPSALSELHDVGRESEMWKQVSQSLLGFLALSVPAGVVISIFARDILEILTTPEIAINSYGIVPLVVLASLAYGTQAILSNVLIVKKKMTVMAWITIISAIICVGANLVLIPKYGLFGAAFALYITYMAQLTLTSQQVFKTYQDWRANYVQQ